MTPAKSVQSTLLGTNKMCCRWTIKQLWRISREWVDGRGLYKCRKWSDYMSDEQSRKASWLSILIQNDAKLWSRNWKYDFAENCANELFEPHIASTSKLSTSIPLAVSAKRSHYRRLFGSIRTAYCSFFRPSVSIRVIVWRKFQVRFWIAEQRPLLRNQNGG